MDLKKAAKHFLVVAASLASSSSHSLRYSLSSMGTVWTVEINPTVASLRERTWNTTALQEGLLQELLVLDTVFSDWAAESEVRSLEKSNMFKWHGASSLFLEGLRLSDEAFRLTRGAFDVTVGAVLWGAAAKPVGMEQLEWSADGRRFRFRKDPQRLTFGGIVKGWATGLIAAKLLRVPGLDSFRIDAGGGNELEWRKDTGVRILSKSRPRRPRTGDRHIFDPKKPTRKLLKRSEVECQLPKTATGSEVARSAAFADVFSKAILIDETLALPKGCQARVTSDGA